MSLVFADWAFACTPRPGADTKAPPSAVTVCEARGSHASTGPAAPATAEEEAPMAAPSADGGPSIDVFDCAKVDEPVRAQCVADIEPTWIGKSDYESMRRLEGGGGPDGASWNPFSVVCEAVLRTPCSSGAASLRLSNHSAHQLPLADAPRQVCRFPLTSEDLEKWADDRSPESVEPVFRTVIVRLEVAQGCGDPPYLGATYDAFVARYAFGE